MDKTRGSSWALRRDFNNFNVYSATMKAHDVVAFTATQIPDIAGERTCGTRRKALSQRIPIYPEDELEELIRKHDVDQAILPSDLSCRHNAQGPTSWRQAQISA